MFPVHIVNKLMIYIKSKLSLIDTSSLIKWVTNKVKIFKVGRIYDFVCTIEKVHKVLTDV